MLQAKIIQDFKGEYAGIEFDDLCFMSDVADAVKLSLEIYGGDSFADDEMYVKLVHEELESLRRNKYSDIVAIFLENFQNNVSSSPNATDCPPFTYLYEITNNRILYTVLRHYKDKDVLLVTGYGGHPDTIESDVMDKIFDIKETEELNYSTIKDIEFGKDDEYAKIVGKNDLDQFEVTITLYQLRCDKDTNKQYWEKFEDIDITLGDEEGSASNE